MLYPIEGDRWILTVAGVGRDYPPTDEAGFLGIYPQRSILYEAIKDAQPLSSIYGYRRTENHRRHYERLSRWPEGFVAVMVCAFNPTPRGMTVAAMGALTVPKSNTSASHGDLTGSAQRRANWSR